MDELELERALVQAILSNQPSRIRQLWLQSHDALDDNNAVRKAAQELVRLFAISDDLDHAILSRDADALNAVMLGLRDATSDGSSEVEAAAQRAVDAAVAIRGARLAHAAGDSATVEAILHAAEKGQQSAELIAALRQLAVRRTSTEVVNDYLDARRHAARREARSLSPERTRPACTRMHVSLPPVQLPKAIAPFDFRAFCAAGGKSRVAGKTVAKSSEWCCSLPRFQKRLLSPKDILFLQQHDEAARLHFEHWKRHADAKLKEAQDRECRLTAERQVLYDRMRAEYQARNEFEVKSWLRAKSRQRAQAAALPPKTRVHPSSRRRRLEGHSEQVAGVRDLGKKRASRSSSSPELRNAPVAALEQSTGLFSSFEQSGACASLETYLLVKEAV